MLSRFKLPILFLFLSAGMSTGLQFLSIPSSANDIIVFRSSFRNPSFLNAQGKSPELSFAYGKWFGETENLSFNWQGKIRSNNAGIAMRYVGINDMELRGNTPTSEPLGYYGAYGVATKAITSFSKGNLNYGFALQLISMQIYQDASTGFAADLGISWQVNEKINLAASVINAGKMNAFRNERPVLPARLNGILSYKINSTDIFLSVETNELIEEPIYSIGSAFKIDNIFFGATAMMNDNLKMISSGIGINLGSYSFSYGFQFGNQDIGFPQIIDISFRLP